MGSFSHTPRDGICLVVRRLGSFSNTPCSRNCLADRRVGSLSYTPRAAICLVIKRISSFSYTPRVGICLVGSRVGNLSYSHKPKTKHTSTIVRPHCSAGEEFFLHAPSWKLSGLSSGGMSIRQAPCCNLFHRSAGGGVSLIRPVL